MSLKSVETPVLESKLPLIYEFANKPAAQFNGYSVCIIDALPEDHYVSITVVCASTTLNNVTTILGVEQRPISSPFHGEDNLDHPNYNIRYIANSYVLYCKAGVSYNLMITSSANATVTGRAIVEYL